MFCFAAHVIVFLLSSMILISRTFKAKPANGILKHEFQLVVIQMIPEEAKVYEHVMKYQLSSTGATYLKVFCGELHVCTILA